VIGVRVSVRPVFAEPAGEVDSIGLVELRAPVSRVRGSRVAAGNSGHGNDITGARYATREPGSRLRDGSGAARPRGESKSPRKRRTPEYLPPLIEIW
jgi:hypothetical protein